MSPIRAPAVAGTFYPAEPQALTSLVQDYLNAASACQHGPPDPAPACPKALVVPHAGFIYSGPIAAMAYATLARAGKGIRQVVLLGPSHRVPLHGLAVSTAAAFMTPLGPVPVDRSAVEELLELPQVRALDAAHAHEHSLETQLPFLQLLLTQWTLVPLVVGDALDRDVAQVLERLWNGPETLIVISSDLSHYLDDASARRLDAATAAAIMALNPGEIGERQACGRVPLRGLLLAARQHGLRPRLLDLRNSSQTAGGPEQVVGYGAFAFF